MIETITDALVRHARERPSAASLIDDRVRLTWGEVKTWVDHAAGWLLAGGYKRGASVLGWLPNCAEWYLLRLACEQAGLLWIPVPASQGRREMASIAERVRPSVLVTMARFRDRDYTAEADEICRRLRLEPARVTVPVDGLLELDGSHPSAGTALKLHEMAHALTTTGSEGIPKLALYTLAAACERAHSQAQLLKLTADDILLTLSPGVGPARAAWLAAPVAGACTVALPVFGTDMALDVIGREQATVVCGTPAQLAMLAAKLGRGNITTVRIWYTAGSVLPETLAQDLESRTHGIVVSTYGGADFGGWAAPEPGDPPAVRWRTVGKPRGGTEFRIVDAKGHDLPEGEVGEAIGRGPCCVSGYIGEQGRGRWRDGWFHMGDLASIDRNGNLVIVGRLSDVINRGGDNVSPAEVEALLRTQPDVAQVAVVGVPDPVLGERVCACVVAAPDRRLDLDLIRQRLRSQGIAHYKLPEQLVVLSAFPLIGDKVDRRALAALAMGSAVR